MLSEGENLLSLRRFLQSETEQRELDKITSYRPMWNIGSRQRWLHKARESTRGLWEIIDFRFKIFIILSWVQAFEKLRERKGTS